MGLFSTGIGAAGTAAAGFSEGAGIASIDGMSDTSQAFTMAGMRANISMQMTGALASVGNNGAKMIADAAKGS